LIFPILVDQIREISREGWGVLVVIVVIVVEIVTGAWPRPDVRTHASDALFIRK
jgi:hypothetical protein